MGTRQHVDTERPGASGQPSSRRADWRSSPPSIATAQTLEAFFRGLDAGDRLLAQVAKIAEIRQKHPGR